MDKEHDCENHIGHFHVAWIHLELVHHLLDVPVIPQEPHHLEQSQHPYQSVQSRKSCQFQQGIVVTLAF